MTTALVDAIFFFFHHSQLPIELLCAYLYSSIFSMPQRIIDQQLCVPIQRSLCLLHSDIDKTDKNHEQNQCFDTEQQQISMKTHLVDLLPKKS
jgi:hypothetical protein